MTNQTSFPDLIEGKTVALVGPADSVGDQGAQVEACDTVIRINYRWRGGEPIAGYGKRLDVAFYNIAGARNLAKNQTLLDSLPCVVLKDGAPAILHPNVRHAARDPFHYANQVPIIVNDIEQFNPAGIFIFGADFFTGGTESFSPPQYRLWDTLQEQWRSLNTHDQQKNHEWLKAFQDRTGLIKGDSRIMELLSLTTDGLMNRLRDAWRSVSG